MSIRIEILDLLGQRGQTINSQRVAGPARGYKGLSYTPRGACLDKSGQCGFSVPMTLRQNYPLGIGATVQLVDTQYGVQGQYVVDDKSETIDAAGHWAQFQCMEITEELVWATVPGFTAVPDETTAGTLGRLLALQDESPWTYTLPTALDGFANVGFQAEDVTIQQAMSKLLVDRFLHWRRGNGRIIEAGNFGAPTGIRIVRPSGNPSLMNRSAIRPIKVGGFAPKADAATLVNCIVPKGAGSGYAQLTLQPLYVAVGESYDAGTGWYTSAPATFPGYDSANFPVRRRIRYDGGGLDGYQYFLADPASIVTYRKRWLPYPRPDIGTISNSVGDLQSAAQALYQVALVYMGWHNVQHKVLAISTDGRGNNVGIAGDTVRVEYREVIGGVTITDEHADYIVMDVVRTINDATGSATDQWTLSNLGRDVASNSASGLLTGALESIQQLRVGPMTYPVERDIHRDQPINANNPVTVHVNLHAGVQRIVQAVFSVQLLPIYSTVASGTVAGHSHTVDIPALSIAAVTTGINETATNGALFGNQFAQGHVAPASQNNHVHTLYNPGAQNLHTHTAPASQFGHGHVLGTAQGAHNHTGWGGTGTGNTSLLGVATGNHAHNGPNNFLAGDTNNNAGGGTSQFSHAHGNSSAAGKTGNVGNGSLAITGGGVVNNSGTVDHQHNIQIGSRAGSGGTPLYFGGSAGSYYLVADGANGNTTATGYSGGGNPTNHGHGSSTAADKSGNVGNGDLAITGGGPVSGAPLAFNPKVGAIFEGSITPSVDLVGHVGFAPWVGIDNGTNPGGGFTPTVYNNPGFTPTVGNDNNQGFTPTVDPHPGATVNSYFPGGTGTQTIATTTQTSNVVAPAWTPVYGIYADPTPAAMSVSVKINNVVVAGPFSAAFSVNLAPYLSGTSPLDVVFTSTALGRLVVEASVRAVVSTYAVGK